MWDVDDLRAFDDRRHIDEFEGDEEDGEDDNYSEETAEDYYEDEREEERLGL